VQRKGVVHGAGPLIVRIPPGRPDALTAKHHLARRTPSRRCDRPGEMAGGSLACGFKTWRATATASRRTWHSQTLTTVHPCSCASRVERWSRSELRRIFAAQSSALGPVHGVLRPCSGHPCQKQPSTKTAMWRDDRTKSGVQPFAICRCSLNLPPAEWTALRRSTSGAVLTLRRPARCPPRSVLTHLSATTPTYVGCTPGKYCSGVREHRLRALRSALTCAYALSREPRPWTLQAGG